MFRMNVNYYTEHGKTPNIKTNSYTLEKLIFQK